MRFQDMADWVAYLSIQDLWQRVWFYSWSTTCDIHTPSSTTFFIRTQIFSSQTRWKKSNHCYEGGDLKHNIGLSVFFASPRLLCSESLQCAALQCLCGGTKKYGLSWLFSLRGRRRRPPDDWLSSTRLGYNTRATSHLYIHYIAMLRLQSITYNKSNF